MECHFLKKVVVFILVTFFIPSILHSERSQAPCYKVVHEEAHVAQNHLHPRACEDLRLTGVSLEASPAPSRLGMWASLVAQWLRICLPMQGTRVRALVWEDPTCWGATGSVSHNY